MYMLLGVIMESSWMPHMDRITCLRRMVSRNTGHAPDRFVRPTPSALGTIFRLALSPFGKAMRSCGAACQSNQAHGQIRSRHYLAVWITSALQHGRGLALH